MVETADSAAARRLEQLLRPQHVRPGEQRRVLHCEAVVGLGGEVDDHVEVVLGERLLDQLEVADVSVDEGHGVRDVLAHARVREQVVGDQLFVRAALEPVTQEVGADEAGGAGDEKPHLRAV